MNTEQQLRREENEVLHVYQDSKGLWTIGVGIMVDKRKGGGLRPEESAFILNNRIKLMTEAVRKALPWSVNLSEARFSVLVQMAFQMGLEGLLAFKNTLAAVKAGNWKVAHDGMLDSKWARTDSPARAKRMAKQMLTGDWQ